MRTAACALACLASCLAAAAQDSIPPHRPLELVGLHVYAQKSVAAGQTIQFRTSSTVPYTLEVCRLGPAVDDPAADEVLARFRQSPPLGQAIHPGSYVLVEKALSADQDLRGLTLECWVRLFGQGTWQTLLSQYDYPAACGFSLGVSPDNCLCFYLGDGREYRKARAHAGPKLQAQRWHHVAGTWDGRDKRLWVDGKQVGQWNCPGPLRPGATALRLGACAVGGLAANFLDGDLAMPTIYGRALSADEIRNRFEEQGLRPAAGHGVLACWPLAEERGPRTADASQHGRHGRIINEATWMIGGPRFDAAKVPRYGPYDPGADPTRGHGLRLASDDLYDCRWRVTQQYLVPPTARPGIYVGRFRFTIDGLERLYHVTFLVKRAPERPRSPLLVLASSGTWLAYNSTAFAVTPPGTHYHWGTNGITNSPGNPPAFGMYRNHRAGQPAYKIGLNQPWPSAGPYVLYEQGGSGYSHLMRAERHVLAWLNRNGYAYDLVGDHELDRDPDLLRGYRAVLVNGHSEYWSANALEGLERYLRGGGNLIVLSGNAMLWRVSFDPSGTVMECRKFDRRFGGRENERYGEMWHSHDGRKGNLLRQCGYPEWKRIGLVPFGWAGIGPRSFGLYRAVRPDHFLFNTPRPVGLAPGEMFGGRGLEALPRAIGHEYDARISIVAKHTPTTPPGEELPQEPPGMVNLADGLLPGAPGVDYFFQNNQKRTEGVVCNMIYWERPEGGRVFNAGSIGFGWGFSADPKLQTLLANVLDHFGVPARQGR